MYRKKCYLQICSIWATSHPLGTDRQDWFLTVVDFVCRCYKWSLIVQGFRPVVLDPPRPMHLAQLSSMNLDSDFTLVTLGTAKSLSDQFPFASYPGDLAASEWGYGLAMYEFPIFSCARPSIWTSFDASSLSMIQKYEDAGESDRSLGQDQTSGERSHVQNPCLVDRLPTPCSGREANVPSISVARWVVY